ncbi:MAG: glycoside hydrolase family 3 C-terminal domain-containing protein [Bacteroidales bacterium]|nr:glycoside hydrolase family 3 C-terminal domain-containing protein [Candidatus Sodaliphilus aphodohippi]
MKLYKKILAMGAVAAMGLTINAQTPLYRNPNAPMHDRIMDLLSRMTLEEKVSMMTHNAPAIPRLGIDKLNIGNEALHGVVRPGKFTVFPQAIGLSATWNPMLIQQMTTAISDEARGKWNKFELGKKQFDGSSDLLCFWSPTINMARDPRWGRTPETYGEDPCLTANIACGFIRGMQGDNPRYIKCVSTLKHFAANNEEHNRASCNAVISERDLREYYFPAYEICVKKANVQSVMTAYNAVNGIPCVANPYLIQKVLRGDWGFDGFMVSDCSAPQWMVTQHKFVKDYETAAVLMMKAGMDLECADNVYTQPLIDAVHHYRVSQADIDSAAYHLLRGRMRLGLFDDPALNPYNSISPDKVGCKEHQQLACEIARQSLVLLKNDKDILPLNPDKTKSVAVVGLNAARCEFGDYSGTPVNEPVSVLDGIKNLVGDKVKIVHAPWVSSSSGYKPISKEFFPKGIKAEYFTNANLEGSPSTVRIEDEIYYDPASQPPDPARSFAPVSARWTGELCPTVSGEYTISLKTDDGCRMWIDGKQVIDAWVSRPAAEDKVPVKLEAGKKYNIVIEYFDGGGDAFARLYWRAPAANDQQRLEFYGDAIKAAKNCDYTIAVMGIDKSIEREGQDRYTMDLPADQKEFLREIYKANPRTILVLIAGSSLSINWEKEHLPAILDAWYPGEQGGNAVAEALFGKYNPGGKLPLTFYASMDDLPEFNDYSLTNGKGRTYQYFTGKPVYEFGYGISYTKFKYKNLKVSTTGDKVNVKFDVTNTGKRDGDEVAQVYIHYPETGTYMPIKQLKAFERAAIATGKTRSFSLDIDREQLRYWDEKTSQFVTPTGTYDIMVGSSSSDIRLQSTFEIK